MHDDKTLEEFYNLFNIPEKLIHDYHGNKKTKLMLDGISKLNIILGDDHKRCINEFIVYCELNIKFLFAVNVLADKEILKEALDIFIDNIVELFKNNHRR